MNLAGIPLPPVDGGFCSARLYRVAIHGTADSENRGEWRCLAARRNDYPKDKIEIVAPVRLKEALGVEDGDQLTLEFGN